MAASSGLAPSFALKSCVNGVGPALSSWPLVRFHGGAVVTISGGRSSLTLRRGGASLVNPRCEAAFDNDALIKSIWPSSVSADRYKRERCSIVVIGLCDPCTPVHTREKLAIVESECPRAIEELCKLDHIEEAVVLSTCSRTEIYVLARCQDRGVSEVTNWISKSSGVPISEICKYRVVLYNKDAVEHLLEVSSGLDLGESRIPAQAMQVPEVGRGVMGYGGMIGMLIISAMIVSRRVRTETSIASGAVCVSSAAVDLALMKLSEFSSSSSSLAMARILVVGAGKMGKLVIQHLVAQGCKKMVVVTPREMRVQVIRMEMKEDVEIIYKPLCEMYDCTAAADVIFTTTTSKKPLFLKQDVVKLPPGPGLRLFIDLSFPRNVGSCVANLGTARVYNVDDLKQVVEAAANNEDRLREVMKERSIIVEETEKFQDWRDSLENHLSLENRRALLEETRIAWLENRLSKFGDDITELQRKAVEDYSRVLINKQLKNMHASKTRMELEVMKFQGWRDVLKNHLTLEDLRAILESSKFGDDITEPQRKAIGDYCRAWINKRLKKPHEASIIN